MKIIYQEIIKNRFLQWMNYYPYSIIITHSEKSRTNIGWYPVANLESIPPEKLRAILVWCNEIYKPEIRCKHSTKKNPNLIYRINQVNLAYGRNLIDHIFYFKNKEDAMLFKLTWVGE